MLALATCAAALTGCSRSDREVTTPEHDTAAAADAVANNSSPLDAAIAAQWREAGVQPVAEATDEEFLRRVTLDLLGRIPTTEETEAFVAGDEADKRAALVDDLLARDGWAEHWADVLTDTLLTGATQIPPRQREGFATWLETELREGRGWDAMVTAMLTAEGESELESASGFLVAHGRKNRVEALTGQTARVMLGLQLQCAQCHDDPDDRFTQEQFYGLGAFYARTKIRSKKADGGGRIAIIVDRPRGEMRLPTEFDAPGDRTGARVSPAFPALAAESRTEETRREALARGIVNSDLFAKAAANHAWATMMGRGIVEPWDDLGGLDGSPHPAALTTLASEFEKQDYDLRALLRTIALSSAYQRSSAGPAEGTVARERVFAQAAVRPMGASQLMRSLLVATGLDDIEGRQFRRQVERRRQQLRKDYDMAFEDDEMASAHRAETNVPQALLLLNGELTNQAIDANAGALAAVLSEHAEPAARIDALYLRLYGRRPTAERRATLTAFVTQHEQPGRAYEDLMHAMLVSSEFLTIH